MARTVAKDYLQLVRLADAPFLQCQLSSDEQRCRSSQGNRAPSQALERQPVDKAKGTFSREFFRYGYSSSLVQIQSDRFPELGCRLDQDDCYRARRSIYLFALCRPAGSGGATPSANNLYRPPSARRGVTSSYARPKGCRYRQVARCGLQAPPEERVVYQRRDRKASVNATPLAPESLNVIEGSPNRQQRHRRLPTLLSHLRNSRLTTWRYRSSVIVNQSVNSRGVGLRSAA